MNKRIVPFLTLMTALLVPGISAQSRSGTPRDSSSEPEQAQVLTSAVRAISRMHMEQFPDSVLWAAAVDGMIKSLKDPYAELYTPAEADAWEEQTTGNYQGIGLQITLLSQDVTVTGVFRGFPASHAGIQVGDVIVGVNDIEAKGWTTQEAADSIRGPAGTNVTVKIRRPGYDQPLSFDVERAEVHVPAVAWGRMDSGVGYVILDRVARGSAQEMSDALDSLQDAPGLIIDLRRNPGGFLDESLMLADLFLKPGSTLASTVQRVPGNPVSEPETDSYTDRWPQRVPDLPVVMLVDGYTASGAEIFAGALQDYDRALVLGERSFGKGLVQTVMELPYGRRLRFTTGTWQTPLGRSLQRARDLQGRALPEDTSKPYPRIQTAGGRTLVDGGGIFPDLNIPVDTLRTTEQRLVQVTNESQFPLAQRLSEFSFQIATARREANEAPSVHDDEFQSFMSSLADQGLPDDLTSNPEVRSYLRWQAQISVAQRMDDVGAEAAARAERDTVLQEAIDLLSKTDSQDGLFAEVDQIKTSQTAAAGPAR